MGLECSSKVFSTDVLRVEISGPKHPHLTFVDLPGLFQAGNKSQSVNDADEGKKLASSYMARPRSIILAVVSAKNDYNNRSVTRYATEHDPNGDRTLVIIAKPDTFHTCRLRLEETIFRTRRKQRCCLPLMLTCLEE